MAPEPLEAGAVQLSSISDVPLARAVNRRGASGTTSSVVSLATLEAGPVPLKLIADTR